MNHTEAAEDANGILTALDGHEDSFTVPLYREVLRLMVEYLDGTLKLTTLIWHLARIRNKAIRHDAMAAGE
jgi:hypothetical protein